VRIGRKGKKGGIERSSAGEDFQPFERGQKNGRNGVVSRDFLKGKKNGVGSHKHGETVGDRDWGLRKNAVLVVKGKGGEDKQFGTEGKLKERSVED